MARLKQLQEVHPDYQADQSKLFDAKIVADWPKYVHDPPWDAVRQFEVDRLFQLVSPHRILNVGCGCGYHDVLMARKPGVESVTGIDYSSVSVAKANEVYSHPSVNRQMVDLLAMQPDSFDMAVSFQVIEHVDDPRAFLAACARQVRSGGWVATLTPNSAKLYNRLRRLVGRPPALEDSWHFREYTIPELVEMGAESGLVYESSFGYMMTLPVPKTGWQLIPWRAGLTLGHMFPGIAHRFCVVMRKL